MCFVLSMWKGLSCMDDLISEHALYSVDTTRDNTVEMSNSLPG